MGLFRRSRHLPATAGEPQVLGPEDTLPATGGDMSDKLVAGGNRAIDKAAGIYRRNPKLVGGLALLAGALVLNKMTHRKA